MHISEILRHFLSVKTMKWSIHRCWHSSGILELCARISTEQEEDDPILIHFQQAGSESMWLASTVGWREVAARLREKDTWNLPLLPPYPDASCIMSFHDWAGHPVMKGDSSFLLTLDIKAINICRGSTKALELLLGAWPMEAVGRNLMHMDSPATPSSLSIK